MSKASIYTFGGTVQAGNGMYIPRKADDELLESCRAGEYSYILTPRQMGKSSLMVRTAERLAGEQIKSVIIDLTLLGSQVTAEQWYLGMLVVICDQLMLDTDVNSWWQQRSHLGITQRLALFFQDVLLEEVSGQVVVFIDEIDSTLGLDFTDDFFAAIRYLFNARATEPALKRLSFVLIGVATPSDLIRDPQRTPFNIGHRVDLTDWTEDEALLLAEGFGLPATDARRVLGWVIKWTAGHPYLTQRLCRAIVDEGRPEWSEGDVKRIVATTFFGGLGEKDNNLQFVRDMLTKRARDPEETLSVYQQVLRRSVPDEERSLVKSHLKLSGVVRKEGGTLVVRNPIYRRMFDKRWIKEQMPANWMKLRMAQLKRVAIGLFVLLILGALAAYAAQQRQEAEEQRKLAAAAGQIAEQKEEAEKQRLEAEKQRDIAEELRKLAEAGLQEAVRQGEIANARLVEVERQRGIAEKARRELESQRNVAMRAQQEAILERKRAEQRLVELERQRKISPDKQE